MIFPKQLSALTHAICGLTACGLCGQTRTVGPSIASLLFSRCPITVLWFVVSVVIASLNRVFWSWSLPHVSKKVFKSFPPITHLDSACSVILPTNLVWVAATPQYTSPNFVFRRVVKAVNCHTLATQSPHFVGSEAAARRCATRFQMRQSNNDNISTLAFAFPKIIGTTTACESFPIKPFSRQPTKYFPGNVFEFVASWSRAFNDIGRFDVLRHIVFSGRRALQGCGFHAFRLAQACRT